MSVDNMPKEKVGFLIKQISNEHTQRLNKMFSCYDLTSAQTFTLIYLFKNKEKGIKVKQRDIEEAMESSNPTITGILNRLESKGLIKRVSSNDDARVKYIEVTEKSLELDDKLKQSFRKEEKDLVACLTKEERKQLEEYLIRILRSNS